jgi:hypothetical protein
MAFPSSSGTKQENLASAWSIARNAAGGIKQRAESLKTSSAAGPIPAASVLDLLTYLADQKLVLSRVAGLTGIAAYAQEQVGDPALNVATEYSNMIAAVDAVRDWVLANFPKDGSGYLLVTQFAGDNSGRTVSRQFSSAETAGLRTVLDALIATID